jgi:hypothetical protein
MIKMRQLAARTDIVVMKVRVSTVTMGHRRLADPVRSTMARTPPPAILAWAASAIPVKPDRKKHHAFDK